MTAAVVAAIAAVIVGIKIHGVLLVVLVLIGVLLAIDRGLVEHATARGVVGPADVVDPGVARHRAA